MKRTLLILLVAILLPATCNAEALTTKEAPNIAGRLLGDTLFSVVKECDSYCIIQRKEGPGYVIIAKDKNAQRRILGFSKESRWDETNMPTALLSWLDKLDIKDAIAGSHTKVCVANQTSFNTKSSISPLLTCHWHQNSPYNDLAPIIEDGNVKTVAGCVAIAAAQITYYWRKDNPESTLRSTPTYIYGGAPITEVVPKGSSNEWNLMLDQYDQTSSSESRAAVAQLCYVLGTTSYLNFASSTGGSIRDAANAMYSQYRLFSTYADKSKFTQEEWEELLYNDLQKGYPVMCSGQGGGGHAFVLDGYDKELDLYHFNFGWGGSGDGYYPIDDTEDAMGGYYMNQSIVYNIHPQTRNIQAGLIVNEELSEMDNCISLTASVTNNSTLPIRHLYLFTSSDDAQPTSLEDAIWEGGYINNDGMRMDFDIAIQMDSAGQNRNLILTDEDFSVLAQITIEVGNGVTMPHKNECNQTPYPIYDIQGRRVNHATRHGLYITDGKKVVIK